MLLNRTRAEIVMDEHGLDGMVAAFPENIYYLTDYWGTMLQMSRNYTVYAVLPRDPTQPAALIMPGPGVYHLERTPTWVPNVATYVTRLAPNLLQPRDFEMTTEEIDVTPPAPPPLMPFKTRPGVPLAPRDEQLLARFAAHGTNPKMTALGALAGALEDAKLTGGLLGFDDPRVLGWLRESNCPTLAGIDALNIFKSIRMIKSPTEIEILKIAGRMSETALNAVVDAIEPGVPLDELRAVHARAMLDQGGQSEWIAINIRGLDTGSVERDELIKLDSVGTYRQYRGDVGRTVICGSPTDEMSRRSRAVSRALEIAYRAIRPGKTFKEIVALTLAACADEGFPGFVIASPHSVGLEHTDHPVSMGTQLPGHYELVFEESMVFTLDMPYHEFGWGTTHVEDMLIVRRDGCEPITSMKNGLIVK